ncbi:MAG: chemotaxis protein CheX [Bacteroidetes bacterium]|nr:chemotaxis protein CheX [Bacteroidota bacterium]
MSEVTANNIFSEKMEIILSSARSLLFGGEVSNDENIIIIKDAENHKLRAYSSEFSLDQEGEDKVIVSANCHVISYFSMMLFGMEIPEGEEDMCQDGLNELLNIIIGNAARDLSKRGLDFLELITPQVGVFDNSRDSFNNYLVIVPTESGEIDFIFSLRD